jgi:lipopolysaccharide/colanic/teichoic acid biosynthesis glycosyltransferase
MNARSFEIYSKYFLDRVFSALFALIFILFFFLPISIVIKIEDGGPVFFRQKRPGLYGKPFYIWKFRTMVPDADALLDGNQRISQGINRVTRIGKILRYLSLDELPQIINILKGEMSFIGPRPALYEAMGKYSEVQKKRFLMKPGITGLAQVNGRNLLKWSKRIEYDLQYIENYSLWLDIKILFKTIKVVLLREGIVLDRNPDQVDDLGKWQ